MSQNSLPAPQFARPLRVAAVILTATSLIRALIEYTAEPVEPVVLGARLAQVVAMLALTIMISARRTVRELQWLTFAVGSVVTFANLVTVPFDPDLAGPTVTIVAVLTMGTALFARWSWHWQAAMAATLAVATIATLVFGVPRTAFPWSYVGLSVFFLAACGGASVWGTQLQGVERRRVSDSEARYRSLFESAGDAIALLDRDGVIRQANARLGELVGRPLDQLVGRPFTDLHAPDQRGTSGEHLVALAGDPQRGAHTLRHADGRLVEVDVSYARTDGGPEPLVQAIVRDLSARRALERREIKDQRADALEGLAGGMAHQFNNILGGILTHASVLREDASDPQMHADLDEILAAARRGRDLTKELLRFTRSTPLSPKPTATAALLESVAALARSSLPAGFAIDMRVSPNVPDLYGDADHLVHACLELVFNARDAMRGADGGRLILAAQSADIAAGDANWPATTPGRYVMISVSDTGRGMDNETRERVFEPFFTTKPMYRAAGMGLAMVYGIVRDHKGSIRLDSAPGRGTTVFILLPVSTAAAVAVPPVSVTAPASAGPDTILIVDDEAIVRHSLRRALTKFGYRVLEAGDGPTALAEMEKANPPVRLVILDLVLPGGGAAILELLRALQPNLKVLVSSGYSPEAETVQELVRRVEGFLPKPYEISELRAAVSKALAG